MARKASVSAARTTRPTKKAGPKKTGPKKAARPAAGKRPKPSRATAASLAPAPRDFLPMFQVDAFTTRVFKGNPAAVVPMPEWLSDETMQAIAAENNLAETAFFRPRVVKKGVPHVELRWFTPEMEMDLCGHATLASAHVLWEELGVGGEEIVFHSRSGPLPVRREQNAAGTLIELDFPARPGRKVNVTNEMSEAIGRPVSEAYRARDLMLVLENRRDVYELRPDMEKLRALGGLGVIVTAPGSGHDFVSRFFAPGAGVPEDPVTGSAHCTLVPYWAARLGKPGLSAHQVSRRGGELRCQFAGERVKIAGFCVTFFEGVIRVR